MSTVPVGRHDDNLGRTVHSFNLTQQRQPVRTGHPQVREHDTIPAWLEQLKRFLSCSSRLHAVAELRKQLGESAPDVGFVIDYEGPPFIPIGSCPLPLPPTSATGIQTVITVPTPSVLSTRILPP